MIVGEIPMPGGWTMSTMWLPMCGHCVRRCAGLTVALLAARIMETAAMACAFAAVVAESVRLRER